MKLPEKEEKAHRESFRKMNAAEKADYIISYYKLPIVLILIAAIIFGSILHRKLTVKEPLVYLGIVNVAIGEDLMGELTDGYLTAAGANPRKQTVEVYGDLYLSNDADTLNHQYAYASRMKVLGSINAEQFDLVFMNREAYDIFSGSGFLMELKDAGIPADLYAVLEPYLKSNEVIVKDNSIDYQLGEAESLEIETKESVNAILLNEFERFRKAGFPDDVYAGVIANTPRLEGVFSYLSYLAES